MGRGLDILLYFYNPNIQPPWEYQRRRDSLAFLGALRSAPVAAPGSLSMEFAPYRPKDFLEAVGPVALSPDRCAACYRLRLRKAAETARERGLPAFTTTLLFSRQQKHDVIREEGGKAAKEFGVAFHYEDFRAGHKEGMRLARELGLYRQSYCGCLYGCSEGGA